MFLIFPLNEILFSNDQVLVMANDECLILENANPPSLLLDLTYTTYTTYLDNPMQRLNFGARLCRSVSCTKAPGSRYHFAYLFA